MVDTRNRTSGIQVSECPLLTQSRRSYKLIEPPFNIYARIISLFIRIKAMILIPTDDLHVADLVKQTES